MCVYSTVSFGIYVTREVAYTWKLTTMASRRSKACDSFSFEEMSFWKIPKIGSNFPCAIMTEAARAVIAWSSRTRAGTLPLDSHRTGASRGLIKA